MYQKENTAGGEWERIGITSKNFFQQKVPLCREYNYGVKVSVGEEESDMVEFDKVVLTKLDESAPYVPHNLQVDETSAGAALSWDHGVFRVTG